MSETAAADTASAAGAGFRLATRGSALATTQSTTVLEALKTSSGVDGALEIIRTEGDVVSSPLAQMGGTGVFVVAVRQALLEKKADVAVHSLKDLPTAEAEGLSIAAIPVREDHRDALCARDGFTIETLPEGASVGTGSPRRAAQLLAVRPDLNVVGIRGNVDTRLSRVKGASVGEHGQEHMTSGKSGDLDAVILAAAGLKRLGREEFITELIEPNLMMPAPGQGALAVETRDLAVAQEAGEADVTFSLSGALAELDHAPTRLAVTAERALLAHLEAGCSAPVGAFAELTGNDDAPLTERVLTLGARVAKTDGTAVVTAGAELPLSVLEEDEYEDGAWDLGVAVATQLLEAGAKDWI